MQAIAEFEKVIHTAYVTPEIYNSLAYTHALNLGLRGTVIQRHLANSICTRETRPAPLCRGRNRISSGKAFYGIRYRSPEDALQIIDSIDTAIRVFMRVLRPAEAIDYSFTVAAR